MDRLLQLIQGNEIWLALVLGAIAMFFPQLSDKLRDLYDNFRFPDINDDDDDKEEEDELLALHREVLNFMDYFSEEEDEEGVKIATRLGNHLYERYLLELNTTQDK